jgi:hypothetical protein
LPVIDTGPTLLKIEIVNFGIHFKRQVQFGITEALFIYRPILTKAVGLTLER